jgi:UDP-galactopyranose mutase
MFPNTKNSFDYSNYDIIRIGAGLSGCVMAERFASIGKKVLIIEKRNHIGGNCYDYIDENGILMNQYGTHLFHTNN